MGKQCRARAVFWWGLLLAVLLLAVGCGNSGAVELDVGDDGRQIEVKQGQILSIELEGNPTTGYTWERGSAEGNILQQVGETEFTPRSELVGAPGVQVMRFKAVKVGQATLELVYHRPWEKDVDPLETWSVEVVVR